MRTAFYQTQTQSCTYATPIQTENIHQLPYWTRSLEQQTTAFTAWTNLDSYTPKRQPDFEADSLDALYTMIHHAQNFKIQINTLFIKSLNTVEFDPNIVHHIPIIILQDNTTKREYNTKSNILTKETLCKPEDNIFDYNTYFEKKSITQKCLCETIKNLPKIIKQRPHHEKDYILYTIHNKQNINNDSITIKKNEERRTSQSILSNLISSIYELQNTCSYLVTCPKDEKNIQIFLKDLQKHINDAVNISWNDIIIYMNDNVYNLHKDGTLHLFKYNVFFDAMIEEKIEHHHQRYLPF